MLKQINFYQFLMFAYTPKLYFFKEIFQNPTIPQSSPLICNPCTQSHTSWPYSLFTFFDPSQYYLWTRVVLNSNVTFSEPEEWTCLQKTSSNLLCFNHWGLSEYLNWELCQFLLLSWNLTSDLLNALNSFRTQGTQRLWMSSEFKSGEGIRILIG